MSFVTILICCLVGFSALSIVKSDDAVKTKSQALQQDEAIDVNKMAAQIEEMKTAMQRQEETIRKNEETNRRQEEVIESLKIGKADSMRIARLASKAESSTVRAASNVTVVPLKAPGPIQYHWVKTPMTWDNARAFCKKTFNVGDLASFPSNRDLKQILKQTATAENWVGGYCNETDPNHCKASEGTMGWRWVTGEVIPINAHGNTEWEAGGSPDGGHNLVFYSVTEAPLRAQPGYAKYYFICSTTTS